MSTTRGRMVWPIALVSTAVLMLPALFNGWPLVYSDTGTYITSGAELGVPADRPITYGLFLRVFSLNGTFIFGVVACQAALAAVLLMRGWSHFVGAKWIIGFIPCVILLALFSGLGWHVGHLMPDVFTSVGLLAILLSMMATQSMWWRMFDLLIVVVATMMHLSHPVIFIVITMITPVLLKSIPWKRVAPPVLAVACGVFLLCSINWRVSGEFESTRGSSHFFLGKALDTGLLPQWLDANCPDANVFLCASKDTLPETSRALLWDPMGPVYQAGGWDATRSDADRIMHSMLSTPHYLAGFASAALKDGLHQLTLWGLGKDMIDTWYRDPVSSPARAIRIHVPRGYQGYMSSRQNTDRLPMKWIESGHVLLLASALFVLLFFSLPARRTKQDKAIRSAWWFSVAAVIAAIICAALSQADPRFLSRVSWLVVFGAAILCVRDRGDQQKSPNVSEG